jgi:uncharacterized protein (DUF342 family)
VLTRDMLEQALAEAGVAPLEASLLDELVAGLPRDVPVDDLTVCTCTAPKFGTDGFIEWLFDASTEARTAGKPGEHGEIDFRERRAFVEVSPGQCIARWHPPVPGTPGKDVRGNPITPTPPLENRIVPGANVSLSEDGTSCFSTLQGHVLAVGARISVDRLLEISGNVDFETGNVHYPGNVHVRGDVLRGFVVEADGNVVIGGTVESAEVRAKGDVLVSGGVVSGARVFAGHALTCKFLLDAHVECGTTLRVLDSIVQSTVADSGSVVTESRSPSKGIRGGRVHTRGEVVTNGLGSELGVTTVIGIGPNPKSVIERKRLRTELAEAHKDLERLTYFLDAAKRRTTSPLADGPSKLEAAYAARQAKLHEVTARLEELDGILAFTSPAGRTVVRAYGTAHEGVEIWVGHASFVVERDLSRTGFRFDASNETIVLCPL